MKRFWKWFIDSIIHPHNLPHWLTAVFTLALAIFACYAWISSQESTEALQGQLLVMQADDRPLIWVISTTGPIYRDKTAQFAWGWTYENIGKGIAYNVVFQQYTKIGNEKFEKGWSISPNFVQQTSGKPFIVSPHLSGDFGTAFSRPGISKDFFMKMMKADLAIGLLVEFDYTDANGKIPFITALCFERISTGAIANVPPADCPKK